MRCNECVNRTEFGKLSFGKHGHYASHARCFVWGCECQRGSIGCKFFEIDPAKRVPDTNEPEFQMEVNVHDFKPTWGRCEIRTAYAKGSWYVGKCFDLTSGCGAYDSPSWWGGKTYETEIEAINAALDSCIHFVERDPQCAEVIRDLQWYKLECRQLTLF